LRKLASSGIDLLFRANVDHGSLAHHLIQL
jgi:hypothetical protein